MANSPFPTVAHAATLLLLPLAALSAWAAPSDAELARARNCLNCHGLDRKIVGPAFKDVAARYAGRTDAVPLLAQKIVKGGGGAWGPVPMAANPALSPDEARRLAAWVLTIK